MNIAQKTIEIHAFSLDYVNAKVATLNKRAAKLGFASVSVRTVREFDRHVLRTFEGGKEVRVRVPMLEVAIDGAAPVVGGWTLAARLEHTAAGNIVNVAPGALLDVEPLRTVDGACEHCGHKRARVETFVLTREGETKRVGRNCLADFVRSSDAVSAVAYWAALAGVVSCENDEDFRSSGARRGTFDVLEHLEWAVVAGRWSGKTKGWDLCAAIGHLREARTPSCGCAEHPEPSAADREHAAGSARG